MLVVSLSKGDSQLLPGDTSLDVSAPYARRQHKGTNLQGVGQELVHLGDLSGDGEVDGSVANLNNQSTQNLGVDLRALESFAGQHAGVF